jgi:hypothetical protein
MYRKIRPERSMDTETIKRRQIDFGGWMGRLIAMLVDILMAFLLIAVAVRTG